MLQKAHTSFDAVVLQEEAQQLHEARLQQLEASTSQHMASSDPLRSSSSSLWSVQSDRSFGNGISKRPDTAFEGASTPSVHPRRQMAADMSGSGRDTAYMPAGCTTCAQEQYSSEGSQDPGACEAASPSQKACSLPVLAEALSQPKAPSRKATKSKASPKVRQLLQQAKLT